MDFLDRVIDEGLQGLASARHGDFLDALRHSLTADDMAYQPASFEPFGFSQRELYTLKVLLLRPLAYAFVRDLGSPLTQSAFDRRTRYAAYEKRYGRAPWLISVRPRIMILTYTEWLGLALDDPPVIPLPDILG